MLVIDFNNYSFSVQINFIVERNKLGFFRIDVIVYFFDLN